MPSRSARQSAGGPAKKKKITSLHSADESRSLVIITGLSGSGKLSALKAFEDMGYYAVDNMPIELVPRFADLIGESTTTTRAALVVDVREGSGLERFPQMLKHIRHILPAKVIYLEASEAVLLRRFSETRRPHPLGRQERVASAIQTERKLLDPIRNVADIIIDTSNFNVHELRSYIQDKFAGTGGGKELLISSLSFGYKNGLPLEADLVFDASFWTRSRSCCSTFSLTTFMKGKAISPLHSDALAGSTVPS